MSGARPGRGGRYVAGSAAAGGVGQGTAVQDQGNPFVVTACSTGSGGTSDFQRTLRGCRSFSRSSRPRTAPVATDRPSRPRGGEDEFAFCGRNANSITNCCRTPGSSTPRQSGPG